jgi:PHD/YefM family antitoxin component YafN of YafNO toxin-antitoxin module
MIELHPQVISRDGKEAFAVLTWEEFTRLREQLDDLIDVVELRTAKAESADQPSKSLDQVAADLGIELD